jgi:AcrR family transcriptional regulator
MSTPTRTRGRNRAPRHAGRRRLPPGQRKAELLDAAIVVLADLGPEGCRVEDITRAAGTAKGNFYRYFETWDDLVVAVRDHVLDSYRAELLGRYEDLSSVDWWAALEEEIERFVAFQLDLGGLHDVIFHGSAAWRSPREVNRSASFLIATFLTAGIEHGAFAAVDVEVTATLLFDVLHGATDVIAAGMDRQRVVAAALRIIRATLEAQS